MDKYICNIWQARPFIGSIVWWDEVVGKCAVLLHSATIDRIEDGLLVLDNGERVELSKLRNLRSFRDGGEFNAKRPCDEIVRPTGWK